ncbi:unnamed protein product, partial [Didymodactylos carnosus]
TLSMVFDCDNEFQIKHKRKPYDYEEFENKLDNETILTCQPLTEENSYGWLRSLIDRFIVNDGIKNIIKQFNDHSLTTKEYYALLSTFANCLDYIIIDKYQHLFNEHVEQAIKHVKKVLNEEENIYEVTTSDSVFDLLTILKTICCSAWPDRIEIIHELQLNIISKLLQSSNMKLRTNALEELVIIIENSTTVLLDVTHKSIDCDILSQWIIENSIVSVALKGDINDSYYLTNTSQLFKFIGSKLTKADIEMIWKAEYNQSILLNDHSFTLLLSACEEFDSEQFECLIDLISEVYFTIQEKIVRNLKSPRLE